jgi:hypothetical protein
LASLLVATGLTLRGQLGFRFSARGSFRCGLRFGLGARLRVRLSALIRSEAGRLVVLGLPRGTFRSLTVSLNLTIDASTTLILGALRLLSPPSLLVRRGSCRPRHRRHRPAALQACPPAPSTPDRAEDRRGR